MSSRDCSFKSETQSPTGDPSRGSSTPLASHPRESPDTLPEHAAASQPVQPLILPHGCSIPKSQLPTPPYPPSSPATPPDFDSDSDSPLNLTHMHLLIHLTSDKEIFNLADHLDDYHHGITLGLTIAVAHPYLLHQLLAFSARRLAHLHHHHQHHHRHHDPATSTAYLRQAVALQTRAVALFNASVGEIDADNCAAVLIFSTVLGHHLLADALAWRPTKGSGGESLFDHFATFFTVNHGIYTIVKTAWSLLMATNLQPILSFSADFTSRDPRCSHCQPLADLLDHNYHHHPDSSSTSTLTPSERDACKTALRYLQVGFDAALSEHPDEPNRYQMIFLWTMLTPIEFSRLLAGGEEKKERKAEALVIMAYYAALLHLGRQLWQVGDAGAWMLRAVEDALVPGWDECMTFPRSVVFAKPG